MHQKSTHVYQTDISEHGDPPALAASRAASTIPQRLLRTEEGWRTFAGTRAAKKRSSRRGAFLSAEASARSKRPAASSSIFPTKLLSSALSRPARVHALSSFKFQASCVRHCSLHCHAVVPLVACMESMLQYVHLPASSNVQHAHRAMPT